MAGRGHSTGDQELYMHRAAFEAEDIHRVHVEGERSGVLATAAGAAVACGRTVVRAMVKAAKARRTAVIMFP